MAAVRFLLVVSLSCLHIALARPKTAFRFRVDNSKIKSLDAMELLEVRLIIKSDFNLFRFFSLFNYRLI